MIYHRFALITFLGFFVCKQAAAQQLNVLRGVVSKQGSTDRIAGVLIKNTRTAELKISDNTGLFNIKAFVNDTLLFSKTGYADQKIPVTSTGDIIVSLQPVISLAEVEIKDKSKQQEIKDVITSYRSKGIYYNGDPPLSAFSPFGGSPITGLYELFSKGTRDEKHFIKVSKEDTEAAAVNRRYTKKLVKQVTALPDSDVVKFMQQYTPSFEDLKEWNDYDLVSHIKKYLSYFIQRKDAVKLQKLY